MTNKELNTLKELMKDEEFKGKKLLDWLIWRNTVVPKFNIGDFVKVSDFSRTVYGRRVVNFNAKVISIDYFVTDKQPHYALEVVFKFSGKSGKNDYIFKVYSTENDLRETALNNLNYIVID